VIRGAKTSLSLLVGFERLQQLELKFNLLRTRQVIQWAVLI